MIVYVAIYEKNHDRDVYVFSDFEAAKAYRRELATDLWPDSLDGIDMPEDPEEAANYYFNESDLDEYFEIEECEVEPPPAPTKLYENGRYYITKELAGFTVYEGDGSYSVYDANVNGFSLAMARCDHLASR